MQSSQDVTFGGGGLDRVAHLRKEPGVVARLWSMADTRIVLFWNGKPLVQADDSGGEELVRLAPNHPAVAELQDEALLVGQIDGQTILACDVSNWEPETDEGFDASAFLDPSAQVFPVLPIGTRFLELRSIMAALSAPDGEINQDTLVRTNTK